MNTRGRANGMPHEATAKIADVSDSLLSIFGHHLTMHMSGIVEHEISGPLPVGGPLPGGAERRLRFAHKVARMLERHDDHDVVRAWFIGANPQLGDDAPADRIRAGDLENVMDATKPNGPGDQTRAAQQQYKRHPVCR